MMEARAVSKILYELHAQMTNRHWLLVYLTTIFNCLDYVASSEIMTYELRFGMNVEVVVAHLRDCARQLPAETKENHETPNHSN